MAAGLLLRGLSLVLASAPLLACGPSTHVWRPQAGPAWLDLHERRVLLLPLTVRQLQDAPQLQAALLGGLLNVLPADTLALQPVLPALEALGLGELSGRLARGLHHAAFEHDGAAWDACAGEDFSGLPEQLPAVIERGALLLGRPDLTPDYVLAVAVDGHGPGSVPRTARYQVLGGLYALAPRQVVVAFDWHETAPEDALIADMAGMGARILKLLEGELPAELRASRAARPTGEESADAASESPPPAPAAPAP